MPKQKDCMNSDLFVTPCSEIRGFFYTSPKLDGIVIRVTFLDNVTYVTYENSLYMYTNCYFICKILNTEDKAMFHKGVPYYAHSYCL